MEAAALNPPPLGRVLVECGLLTEEQVTEALEEQQRSGRKLGEILVSSGVVSGPAIANALAEQRGTVIKTEYGFGTGLTSRRRPAEPVAPPPVEAPQPAPAPAPEQPDRVAELEADVAAREARIAELQAELARRATKVETLHVRISQLEQELAAGPEPLPGETGEYVLVLPGAAGYRLVARHGSVPPVGSRVSVGGSVFAAVRVGASPLRDGRPAVFLDDEAS
jgi:uncharacterized coiled-coil protein SlyX